MFRAFPLPIIMSSLNVHLALVYVIRFEVSLLYPCRFKGYSEWRLYLKVTKHHPLLLMLPSFDLISNYCHF
jgi:hypothetical protein